MLFNKRPFPDLDNEFRVLTAIEKRESPWKWNDAVPLERILSTCSHPLEGSRPTIDTVLRKLHPFFNSSLNVPPSADPVVKVDPVFYPATEILTRFERSLESVRDVSRQLDNKSLRVRGAFSAVYKTRWVPPGALPMEVSLILYPRCLSMKSKPRQL